MDSNEMWEQYQRFIIGKAIEFHRSFPNVLELQEKISIAWIFAEQARRSFDETKGKFTTYSTKAINTGLFKAINKEIKVNKRKSLEVKINDIENSHMYLDDRINSLLTIEKSEAGRFAWLNKVYGKTINEIALETDINKTKIQREIKKFQMK